MHVCAIATARATIGGPSFELRTPSRNASFHCRTRLPPAWTLRALKASLGSASDAAPAPAATRNCRRESDCSRADERDLLRPREIEPPDEEVKTWRLSVAENGAAMPTYPPAASHPQPGHSQHRTAAHAQTSDITHKSGTRTRHSGEA